MGNDNFLGTMVLSFLFIAFVAIIGEGYIKDISKKRNGPYYNVQMVIKTKTVTVEEINDLKTELEEWFPESEILTVEVQPDTTN